MGSRRGALAGLIVAALVLVSVLAGATGLREGGHAQRHGTSLTVMTRNLYLGANLTRALAAARAPPGRQLDVLIGAATTIRRIADETNFPLRAQRVAAEIAAHRPDLVGLQETALWRHGQLGAPATTVDYDFLKLLLSALSARGEQYRAVVVQQESDVTVPGYLNGTLQNLRLTVRDVVLKRADDGVRVLDASGANYLVGIPITLAGQTASFLRGYDVVDVRAGGQTVRFINTHLASESADIAYAQARELRAGPARARKLPTILVCDCNADPLNASVAPGATHARRDAYRAIVGAGFSDEWLRFAPAAAGFTSGLSELVNDAPRQAAAKFNHRIDFVFGRRANGAPMPVERAWVVGKDPGERTPPTRIGQLWPSDHAGVIVRLRP